MLTVAIDDQFAKVRDELLAKKAEKNILGGLLASKESMECASIDRLRRLSDCVAMTQKFSEGIQSGVVKKFEDLLTRGVREVFDKDYKISIEFSSPGNTLSADFFVTLPDGKVVNLAKGEGGGLRDLVAVLMRVLYLVLEPTHPAKMVILDESFKFVDVGRAPKAFAFLRDLCSELGVQLVIVSHHQAVKELDGQGVKIIEIGGN